MTALRPERESAPYGGEAAYGGAESFEAEAFDPGVPFRDTAEPQQWAAQQGSSYAQGDWYGQQPYTEPAFEPYESYAQRPQAPYDGMYDPYAATGVQGGLSADTAQEHPPIDEETVALRVEEARRIAAAAESI
ncbi:MAG TPA: class E sortase, partial [Streptomyces sp.]|nr:class E sortase [Streptomyces sp.]